MTTLKAVSIEIVEFKDTCRRYECIDNYRRKKSHVFKAMCDLADYSKIRPIVVREQQDKFNALLIKWLGRLCIRYQSYWSFISYWSGRRVRFSSLSRDFVDEKPNVCETGRMTVPGPVRKRITLTYTWSIGISVRSFGRAESVSFANCFNAEYSPVD